MENLRCFFSINFQGLGQNTNREMRGACQLVENKSQSIHSPEHGLIRNMNSRKGSHPLFCNDARC